MKTNQTPQPDNLLMLQKYYALPKEIREECKSYFQLRLNKREIFDKLRVRNTSSQLFIFHNMVSYKLHIRNAQTCDTLFDLNLQDEYYRVSFRQHEKGNFAIMYVDKNQELHYK